MLYMAEMAKNFRFLLLVLTLEDPQKCKVTKCIVQFGGIEGYGKKCAKSWPAEK